jgi:fructan beta-fructosidase
MSGAAECPDLFLLAIANDPQTQYWIFTGANGSYLVGQFDGDRFTRLEGPIHPEYGANFYAVQTFFDIPEKDGRRNERLSQQPSAYQDGKVADCEAISRESILLCTEPSAARHRSNVTKVQIAWMAGGIYPDMPFNQQMSIPCSLSLHRTADGIRMYRYPVQELQTLRRHKLIDSSSTLISGLDPLSDIHANLVDLEMELTYRTGGNLTFILRGTEITYDFDTLTLSCLGRSTLVEPIELNVDLLQQQAADVGSISTEGADSLIRPSTAGGESSVKMVKLRILLDKSSIEIFANAGAVSMSFAISPDENNSMLSCKLLGQPLDIKKLLVFALASVWN